MNTKGQKVEVCFRRAKLIGSGTYGVVFSAYMPRLRKRVAVKYAPLDRAEIRNNKELSRLTKVTPKYYGYISGSVDSLSVDRVLGQDVFQGISANLLPSPMRRRPRKPHQIRKELLGKQNQVMFLVTELFDASLEQLKKSKRKTRAMDKKKVAAAKELAKYFEHHDMHDRNFLYRESDGKVVVADLDGKLLV